MPTVGCISGDAGEQEFKSIHWVVACNSGDEGRMSFSVVPSTEPCVLQPSNLGLEFTAFLDTITPTSEARYTQSCSLFTTAGTKVVWCFQEIAGTPTLVNNSVHVASWGGFPANFTSKRRAFAVSHGEPA